ncbi:hypothetical protein [Alkalicoccobacillus murimartini]|uniref:Aspartyl protease n=1 Tax=Alkalicoccobacillus murimartini TaxID=171685 RepID=A0ABT9YI27_9BACI|nr:hypothetical protein [Alkalicoccobacillus murimartini]MDQ0207517.1 putative aspartyl protease [Alkalicoccobacillus murimartini]
MSTEMIMLLTILLFIIVYGFLFIQLNRATQQGKIWFFVFLVISAGPLIYMLYDDYTQDYLDANIGLGLAYFYTWFMTVLAAVVAIVVSLRKK